ncbi:Transposase IS200 like protein [Clostridium formicaceticum]|uniref:Transposase IS200 like protein n=2 Tax=Clostridium formicaceticum TaxID=1497 RepID=A0AAC9RMZ6_9CLOT|nr:Transposase IS200 like protein [Clostridium formicaceticum]
MINMARTARKKTEFTVYGYCLMTNHVHILLKAESEEIGNVVRRITVGYAQYHNIKNGRSGHLFQNRFKSERVNTDDYFLIVLRYIHQNPIKAGVIERIEDYKWSNTLPIMKVRSRRTIIIAFFILYTSLQSIIFKSFKNITLRY